MKKPFAEIPRLEGRRIVLKRVEMADAEALGELARSPVVYRYEPTFLFERKYADPRDVIGRLYGECLKSEGSLILGIFLREDPRFCGLAEMYGFRDEIHKISIGYRLLEREWGRGLATETVGLLVDYLLGQTDIEIITASTMVSNHASANVLRKNGFELVAAAVGEDWGFAEPTPTDKWIL